ncbi:MAG: winged helix-turn-helix domain-containing protein [Candidatus Micrarchaeota archaeon]
MDSKTRLLYWLLSASRGGPTRVRILGVLCRKPMNMRQLALATKLDYKTVQGHVELLMENHVLETPRKKYGSVYFISPEWEDNEYLIELMRGNDDGKRKKG